MGASNFGSNDDVFGFSFPLVVYMAENYAYDEETDSETEERDYDADNWEYEDAISDAEDLAYEMGIDFRKNNPDNYVDSDNVDVPFAVTIRNGYYEGLYIKVLEGHDSWWDSEDEEEVPYDEVQMNDFADKINDYLDKLCSDYGWQKVGVSARFDNGETWYSKIDNSRKPIKSEVDYDDSYAKEFDDMVEENGYDVNERFTYMAGIQPEDWTDEDSKQAEFYNLDVAGYYKIGDAEGMVLVGTLKDIYDYCDNYFGMGLHPDYVCLADSFDYEDGEWVTGGWIDSSVKKPIKSSGSEEWFGLEMIYDQLSEYFRDYGFNDVRFEGIDDTKARVVFQGWHEYDIDQFYKNITNISHYFSNEVVPIWFTMDVVNGGSCKLVVNVEKPM